MSNSEPILTEKDQKAIKSEFMLRPTLEFPAECRIASSEDRELRRREKEEKKEEKCENLVSSEELNMPSLGEFKVDDNDDGFRTPTSLDHKIPMIQKCPPAPRKPKSLPSTKRKSSPNFHHLRVHDLSSEEIESLFLPFLADLSRKLKKVRGDDMTK